MLILIEVEVERTSGKFQPKDDIAQAIIDLVDGNDLDVDESTYEVRSVSQIEAFKPMAPMGRAPKGAAVKSMQPRVVERTPTGEPIATKCKDCGSVFPADAWPEHEAEEHQR